MGEEIKPVTTEEPETMHIHYFPDAIVILKEEEPPETDIVETSQFAYAD